jgi:hypothetical protein
MGLLSMVSVGVTASNLALELYILAKDIIPEL